MVAHLSWATWAIRSQLLICLVRSERITHSSSFDLSELSDWAKERIPSPAQTTLWGSSCGQDSNPWQADLSQEHWQLHHCTCTCTSLGIFSLFNYYSSNVSCQQIWQCWWVTPIYLFWQCGRRVISCQLGMQKTPWGPSGPSGLSGPFRPLGPSIIDGMLTKYSS